MNPLSGNADILSPDEAQLLTGLMRGEDGDSDFIADLTSKGYIIAPDEEKSQFQAKYLDFIDARDEDDERYRGKREVEHAISGGRRAGMSSAKVAALAASLPIIALIASLSTTAE